MSLFEQATRNKVRFETPQGMLTVEDLWDIPLTSARGRANLDDIARALHRKIKETETESFVIKAPKADELTQLKFELVKHVIDVRLAENAAAEQLRLNREKKQQLLALIAQKENEQLQGHTLEELKAMAEGL